MNLKIFNTLKHSVEDFKPSDKHKVKLYTCGPTVYNNVHIGNLRSYINADVLKRALEFNGYAVDWVMNVTDVDDKTIARSHEKYPDLDPMGALKKLTIEYGDLFLADMHAIGNDVDALTFVKAADDDTIENMKQLITELHQSGFAYIADDGVYFSIDAYKKSGKIYGQLAEVTESSTASERIQNDEYDKDSAHDFALWKIQKSGEPAWDFEIDGHDLNGRPGWHIECSVMSHMKLGQPFDIHTGGIDLIFPHHENEIAQSTALSNDKTYAHTFVHNEHILVDGKKMSKSAHNFYTLADLKEKGVDALSFRLLVLQSHYRRPTNFSLDNAEAAHNRLHHWRNVAALRHQVSADTSNDMDPSPAAVSAIREAVSDDLNTPEALRIVDETFTFVESRGLTTINRTTLVELLESIDDILGLQLMSTTPDISDEQKLLIQKRKDARYAKDWVASDALRDQLLSQGIIVRDETHGTVWEYAG